MGWATSGVSSAFGASWADGYVIDTPYTEGITSDFCPAWLSMAAVLHGQPPLDLTRTLTWIDLGCGSGLPAVGVAATNANVEVWGCDFNPSHVERARALAAKVGLTNCTFDEASFAEVASDECLGPPEADVIVVHGVYSWISSENQRRVVEFIRRRLRSGGLAVVMYEAATGWAAMAPIAEAMRLHAEADRRQSHAAFKGAAETMQRLADGGARYFPLPPCEAKQFADLSGANERYAAHEYLGAHFQPLMFDDVAQLMTDARCSFLGSLESTDHMTAYWVPAPLAELVTNTPDVVLREMMRDLATQRMLRRDVWRRGAVVHNPLEHAPWLKDLRIVGLGKEFAEAERVGVPAGEVDLDAKYHVPLVSALVSEPIGVDRICEVHPEWGIADAAAALGLLVSGGYAAPEVRGWADSAATRVSTRRLNEVLIAENRLGADHGVLVAPALGSSVATEYVRMLTLGAIWEGVPRQVDALVTWVQDEIDRQGRALREEGRVVDDPGEADEILRRRVTDALHRFETTWPRLGV